MNGTKPNVGRLTVYSTLLITCSAISSGSHPLRQDSTCLDPTVQPRMPWQDYQMQIDGPAVYDLVRNFVFRWNSYSHPYRTIR
jgi:phosphatidylserine/phosphatidylglycerophosphate/cardiolipin synthase-like enzyme